MSPLEPVRIYWATKPFLLRKAKCVPFRTGPDLKCVPFRTGPDLFRTGSDLLFRFFVGGFETGEGLLYKPD